MPSTTSIKQIVKDLNERKSEIARKFDDCSKDSKRRATILNLIKPENWDPSSQDLPAGVITELGLTTAEVAHINAWPSSDKGRVRGKIVEAITGDRNIEFFWDLHHDLDATTSESDIDDQPALIKVSFLTPRGNVTKSGLTYGDIEVGV